MNSVDEVVNKITEASGKPLEEIKKLIEEKQRELSGLVSEEGAAYMVGRELGVTLLKESDRTLKIKNLMGGLRSVELVVRVLRKFEPREFSKNGRSGKVANILIGDETGTCRMSFWNDDIKKLDDIQENDVIRISGGWVKMDYRGEPELRLGKGTMEKVDADVKVREVQKESRPGGFGEARRMSISDLKDGSFGEVRASLVQIYNRKPFYNICPECKGRVEETDGKFTCKEHGEVQPAWAMVLSGVIDDGTGNIRAVFFREMAEKLFGKTAEELRAIAQEKADALAVYELFPSLGKEMIFRGRAKISSFSESLEFVVNEVADVDVKKEAEELIQELSEDN